jgi:hypothetical protein
MEEKVAAVQRTIGEGATSGQGTCSFTPPANGIPDKDVPQRGILDFFMTKNYKYYFKVT